MNFNSRIPEFSHISPFRKRGFSFISQALACEETCTDLDLAPILYSLGIRELEKGIGLCGVDDSDPRIFQLRREMLASLSRAKDRLEALRIGNTNRSNANNSTQTSPFIPQNSELDFTPTKSVKLQVQNFEQKSAESPVRGSPSLHFTRPTIASILKGRDRSQSPKNSPIDRKIVRKPASIQSQTKSVQVETTSNGSKNAPGRGFSDYLSSTIVHPNTGVTFSDVIGHGKAKQALQEMVILPALRPELFGGLRTPAKGLLLFGPPGNGKTLLAKALASEAKATLFNITAAALTSKFVGDGEKMVRELFLMAREKAPSIIFIDEIDSILCSRKSNDHEASRRLKTEFFTSFDGLLSSTNERLIVVGATNRPQELDDAALRRFSKRVYVSLPDFDTREYLLNKLLSEHSNHLSSKEVSQVARATAGYSCSDITSLAREAALGPLRELGADMLKTVTADQIRPIQLEDFRRALPRVRTSVNSEMLSLLEQWNRTYGDVS